MKDTAIFEALQLELKRQRENVELIASENYVSEEVMAVQGSILTNKYAEGYPNKRYYGGCEFVDTIEDIARNRAKQLFGAKFANVQPHSGSQANMGAYRAVLEPGAKVLGMKLSQGGHLTHGHPMNFSGKEYNIVSYTVDKESGIIDYNELRNIALETKPKMIIAGASAYSRMIDFAKFREIANEVGAYLMVDMAHIAGLVATGLHPSPVPYADVITTTTHKTLRGPRGGLILTNDEEIITKINKTIFPGIQGGPLMHVIAAKAQCFYEAMEPSFKDYTTNIIKNAKALSKTFIDNGVKVISGGTDNHLMLIDVKSSFGITGKEAETILDKINITTNKNTIPNDTESPFKTSGLRIGTPAMTTRGFTTEDFEEVGIIIIEALRNKDNEEVLDNLRKQVLRLTSSHPLYRKGV